MAQSEASPRERMIGRIRQATARKQKFQAPETNLNAFFPPIDDAHQRFLSECSANLTEVLETSNLAESRAALETVLTSLNAREVFLQEDPVLRNLVSGLNNAWSVRWSSEGAPFESTEATVTLAHAFVAQTGSILSSSDCGGRGASIVPPCHIVYGRREQIVPDIAAALKQVQSTDVVDASYVGLITGSSRTADIEKILVQGAHGPRRVVVILEA